jgi:hypothetical protein
MGGETISSSDGGERSMPNQGKGRLVTCEASKRGERCDFDGEAARLAARDECECMSGRSPH